MVDDTAEAIFAAEDDHIDLSTLARLGAWGLAATAALAIAVVAAQSETGAKRISTALAVIKVPGSRPTAASLLARANEPDREAREMAETLRMLAADRDRMASRIAALERNLDDLTGSIPRFPALSRPNANTATPKAGAVAADLPTLAPGPPPAPPVAKWPEASGPTASAPGAPPPQPAAPPVVAAPPAAAAPASPPAAEAPPRAPAAAVAQAPAAPAPAAKAPQVPVAQVPGTQPAPAQAAPAEPTPAQPTPAQPTPMQAAPRQIPAPPAAQAPAAHNPTQIVTSPIPPPPAPAAPATADNAEATLDNPGADSVATRTEFAVDLGGATTMQGLRVIWASLRSKHSALLEGLRPLVAVRETARPGGVQLRLVVGPLADAGAAARLCAVLASTGRLCDTAVFDGQRLTLR